MTSRILWPEGGVEQAMINFAEAVAPTCGTRMRKPILVFLSMNKSGADCSVFSKRIAFKEDKSIDPCDWRSVPRLADDLVHQQIVPSSHL